LAFSSRRRQASPPSPPGVAAVADVASREVMHFNDDDDFEIVIRQPLAQPEKPIAVPAHNFAARVCVFPGDARLRKPFSRSIAITGEGEIKSPNADQPSLSFASISLAVFFFLFFFFPFFSLSLSLSLFFFSCFCLD